MIRAFGGGQGEILNSSEVDRVNGRIRIERQPARHIPADAVDIDVVLSDEVGADRLVLVMQLDGVQSVKNLVTVSDESIVIIAKGCA